MALFRRLTVGQLVSRYQAGFQTLRDLSPGVLSAVDRDTVEERSAGLVQAGAPEPLAVNAAILQTLTTAGDLVDLAASSSWPLANAARLYHRAGEAFGFDRLRSAVGRYTAGDHFERTAVRRLVEDLLAEQTAVTRAIISFAANPEAGESAEAADAAVASWSSLRREAVAVARRTLEEIEASAGAWTFAKLTIANAALRELATAGEAGGRRRAGR
jgi:glutamate dehydrogenase